MYRHFTLFGLLLLGHLAPLGAQTTRLVAPSGADAGDCTGNPCATIRYAISQATQGDQIRAAAGTYIEVNVVVDRDVAIRGAGPNRTIVQAAPLPWTAPGRVFTIAEGATVVIEGLTIRHGHDIELARGGGLMNLGDVTLRRVAVLNNVAPEAGILDYGPAGGGLYNQGTMRLERVLVRGNVAERVDPDIGASSAGGGIYNHGVTGTEALYVVDSIVDDNFAEVSGGIELIDDECYCPGPLLRIERSTISRNEAVRAGGVRNAGGEATIVNSTLSGNRATGLFGGGIENGWGTLLLSHSTLTGNSAFLYGGGIYGLTFALRNTLIAGNTAPEGSDCYSMNVMPPPTSLDYNLIGDPDGCALEGETDHTVFGVDPLIGRLALNGGPTPTHALLDGSPAIDAGTCVSEGGAPVQVDQRGAARSEPCDIGAFEREAGGLVAEGTAGAPAPAVGRPALSAPSPNPFSIAAGLTLVVEETQRVRVTLYDVLGRQVAVLFEGTLAAGVVQPIEVGGEGLPGGVYVVVAEGERFQAQRRVTRTR